MKQTHVHGNKRERIEVGLYSSVCHLLGHLLPSMKKIGYADPMWSFREAVKKQIEIEDRVVFAKQPIAEITRDYRPQKFELTETAKYVLGRSISLFKL